MTKTAVCPRDERAQKPNGPWVGAVARGGWMSDCVLGQGAA